MSDVYVANNTSRIIHACVEQSGEILSAEACNVDDIKNPRIVHQEELPPLLATHRWCRRCASHLTL